MDGRREDLPEPRRSDMRRAAVADCLRLFMEIKCERRKDWTQGRAYHSKEGLSMWSGVEMEGDKYSIVI